MKVSKERICLKKFGRVFKDVSYVFNDLYLYAFIGRVFYQYPTCQRAGSHARSNASIKFSLASLLNFDDSIVGKMRRCQQCKADRITSESPMNQPV